MKPAPCSSARAVLSAPDAKKAPTVASGPTNSRAEGTTGMA